MEQKKVSVIMPAYNLERFIGETIDSVIAQTYQNWELLILDDCSSDKTLEIAKGYAEKDPRIIVLKNEQNMGVAKTRNKGLDISSGDYAALLDADDYWEPKFLEKMVEKEEETGADFVYCSYAIVDENKERICSDFIVPETTNFEESVIRNVISCSTVLFNTEMKKTARFPMGVYHEDIALWFKSLKEGKTASGVTEVLAFYRQSGNTRSGNKLKSAYYRWEIYRDYLGLSLIESAKYFINYAFLGLKKYRKIKKG